MIVSVRRMGRVIAGVAAGLCLGAFAVRGVSAQTVADVPAQARGLDIDEHLGRQIPHEIQFVNADGKTILLGDYFKDNNKPIILAMVYYRCPVVCSVVMDKLFECVNKLDLTMGKDFKVLVFSFNPDEGTDLAAKHREFFLTKYPKPVTERTRESCQFHTGDEASSRELANAVGFRYRKLENGEYSHPVAIFVATPEGKVSRYIYGFDYPPRDVKLSLMDAASGKLTRTIGDRVLSFCYMFDPKAGAYTLRAVRVMQVAGVLTLLGVGGLIAGLFAAERVRRARRLSVSSAGSPASSGVS